MDERDAEEHIVKVSAGNGIKQIIFNRPKKRNAITTKMYQDVTNILNDLSKDDGVNMVVFTGEGDTFTSGNDFMQLLSEGDYRTNLTLGLTSFKKFIEALIVFPKLLVAIVNGPAIGVGTTMLGIFDMVYASDKAYFYTPFTKLGLVAEGCSSYTFPKIMGPNKAFDMLCFAYKMDANKAKKYRLVKEVYKNVEDVWTYLRRIDQLSTVSILATKGLMQKWNKETLLEVNRTEVEELLNAVESDDFVERFSQIIFNKSKL